MDDASRQERMDRLRELRELYFQSHAEGMEALRTGDFRAVSLAIRTEGRILKEQAQIIAELREATRR